MLLADQREPISAVARAELPPSLLVGVPGPPRRLLLRGASGGTCMLDLTHSDYPRALPLFASFTVRAASSRVTSRQFSAVPPSRAKARRVSCTEMDRAWSERSRFPKTGKYAVDHTCSNYQ